MSNVFAFRQPPFGFINEYAGGGGKGGTTTSSQTVSIPPEVLARYNAVNARAEETAQQPFQQYGGEFVAPLTPTQVAGTQATNAAAGQAQPYYGAATALTLGGAKNVGPLTQGQIGYYQNPYTQAVVNPTVQALQQQQGQQLAEQQAQAIKGGAFGGDRANLQRSQLQGQQNLALGQAIAPLYQQGYGQAVQTAQGQQGVVAQDLARQMQAGQQIAGLGTGAQQASLQGAQAQLAAGQVGQQTQQAQDTAQYQQFLQERGYPFQVSQFLANIAMGTGALSGSTTSGTQTSPGGFFSDKRLKDDVREIGETHDGQPIYSYKYKGDDRTQIGLMAQDVEKKHPDAVGLMGGYKTVDYKKATEGAERTHKDMGGGLMPEGFDPNSMGGAVNPDMAGESFMRGGYVGGGLVDSNDWAQIVAANKQALGMYGGAQPMGGGAPGATGIVPAANIPVPKPIEAAKMSMPAQRPSGMSTAMQTGKDIAGAYSMGKSGLIGSAKTAADPEGTAGLIGGQGEFSGKNIFSKAKELFAADGGFIVPRHAYALGGSDDEDVTPYDVKDTMSGQDPMKEVLRSGSQKPQQLKAAQMSMGSGGQGGQSGIGQLASGLGAAKSLYGMGSGALSGLGELGAGFSSAGNAAGLDAVLGPGFFAENIGLGAGGASAAGSGLMGSIGSGLGSLFAEAGPFALLLKDGGRIPAYADGGLIPRQGYYEGGPTDVPADYSPEADMPSPNAQEAGLVAEKPRDTGSLFAGIEDKYGLPSGYLNRAWQIESGAGQNMKSPSSSARGHFQFIEGTQKQMGLKDPYDLAESADAAARYAAQNRQFLKLHGVEEPSAGHLYLAHQQGPLGAVRLLNAKDRSAGEAVGNPLAISGNRGDPNASGLTFANQIMNKFSGIKEPVSGPIPEGAPRPPGVMGGTDVRAPSTGAEGKKSIGDVVTSEGFIVPALGFLGSMLASNRPNLGQALGEGIMGGVGAYQSQKKQTAELAKGVLDIVKDRFHITTDPKTGQTVYFNKATGAPVSAGQYAQAVGGIADSLGVPRGILGIPTTGVDIPSISGGPTKPGEFSRPGLPLRTGEPTKVGEQTSSEKPIEKSATPELVEDIRKMGPTQLMDYARKNKDKYGLNGDRDPDVKQEEFNEYRRLAQSARLSGNTADAAAYENLAKDSQERMKQYLNDAVKLQLVNNEEIAKANVKSSADYMGDVVARMGTHDDARGSLVRLADIYSRYEPSRAAQIKAELGDWANQFKVDLGPNFATAPVDEAIKIATSQAISAAGSSQLGRAPKVVLENELRTVPSPTLAPGAVYSIIGRTIGQIDYANARDRAYADKGLGTEVPKFISEFTGREKPSKYISGAFAEIPVARGMKRDELESLMKTYKFTPKQETEAGQPREITPAAPSAPAVGAVLQGYKFNGGNPADQSNWTKVQ